MDIEIQAFDPVIQVLSFAVVSWILKNWMKSKLLSKNLQLAVASGIHRTVEQLQGVSDPCRLRWERRQQRISLRETVSQNQLKQSGLMGRLL